MRNIKGFIGNPFIWIIVIAIILGVSHFYFGVSFSTIKTYFNNNEKINETIQNIKKNMASEVDVRVNSDFPHWTSKTIKYSFDPDYVCDAEKRKNILSAFDILHNKTNGLLSYVESSSGKLIISCHDMVGSASGWGAPWLYPDGEIVKATIDFYQIPPGAIECETYPTLELHETLHTLGFEDDFSSEQGIMYFGRNGGYWNPCRKIDEKIVECLKNVYSNGKEGSSCTGIPHKAYGVPGTSLD